MENPKSKYFMTLALMQANKVLGKTRTNPAVGCVIVKNNSLISAASTSFNGRPHAESNALKKIKKKDKKVSLYSTLEPCSHYGKTSPCVNKIINKKIKKVFFSIKDPDIRTYNKSLTILKKNKISTFTNIISSEVNNFYRSYIKFKTKKLPFVTCKLAASKDYYLNNRKNKNITNHFSRSRAHLLRYNHDCILSSSSTVIDDNPRFTCRIPGLKKRSPARIILDSGLNIPINYNIIQLAKKYRTIIFYNKIKKKKIKILKKMNIKLLREPLCSDENFDLKKILLKVKRLGFSRILLESGLKLSSNFFKYKLVDDFYLFISNKNVNRHGKNNIKKLLKSYVKNKKHVDIKVNLFGDKLIRYKI